MKKGDRHYQFTPIIDKFGYQLKIRDVQPEDVQLQIKYGYLKTNKNQTVFKSLVNSSKIRPIDLNQGQNKYNFKVNARCSLQQHNKARNFLQQLQKKSNFKKQEKYHLWLNEGQNKYLYDCSSELWLSVHKEQLIKFQHNFLYQNRLFRINLSQKKEEKKISPVQMRDILQYKIKSQSCLRYKHIYVYKAHPYYEIWSSVVFETQEPAQFDKLGILINEKGNLINGKVKTIIDHKEKSKQDIKYELQLKFSPKGVELIKQENKQTERQFSKAFDFFTELTQKQSRSEQELIRMMEQLGLQQQKRQKKEVQEIKLKKSGQKQKSEQKQKQEETQYIVKK